MLAPVAASGQLPIRHTGLLQPRVFSVFVPDRKTGPPESRVTGFETILPRRRWMYGDSVQTGH